MDIFINNEKIDFELENETMLHQVVDGLISWAAGGGYQIRSVQFDGAEYQSGDPACRETPVDSVKRMDLSAKNRLEIHEENLQLLHQYVSLLRKSIEGKNIKLVKELQADADSVTRLLADFLGENWSSEDSVSRRLYENLMTFNAAAPEENAETRNVLTNQLAGLDIILNERILELADPFGELRKTVLAMKASVEEINNISVLLQTGKDREALSSIIKFSELSQKVLRIYPVLQSGGIVDLESIEIDGNSFSGYYNDLNAILTELIEAFTANDSVLIGDLLEYEVAPRIESLINALEHLQEE